MAFNLPCLFRVVSVLVVFAVIHSAFGALRIRRQAVPEDQRCPGAEWAHYQSKCYLIETEKVDKDKAARECRRVDAGLVDIETEAEWKFLTSLMDQHLGKPNGQWIGLWTGGYRTGIRWKWGSQTLKLKDKKEESEDEKALIRYTETSDYIPITFEYWFGDEPNQGGISDVIGMTLAKDTLSWGWRDRVGEFVYPYICEKAKTSSCDRGWSGYGQSCYWLGKSTQRSQTEAKTDCRSKKGHLVAIESRKENEFIISLVKGEKKFREWWIGGEKIGGKFAWDITVPSQKPYMIQWGRSPKGTNGSYMSLIKDKGEWWWKVAARDKKLQYVCEIPVQQSKFFKCPGNYIYTNNACYELSFEKVSRQKAATACNNDGGYLLALDNEAEVERFATLMKELRSNDEIWTGGIMVDSKWVWSRDYRKFLGSSNQFLAWTEGEPNNYDGLENLLIIGRGTKWYWNDAPGELRLGYICEKGARAYEPIEYNKACKTNRVGDGYVGTLSTTRQGAACRRWDSPLSLYNKPNKLHLFPDNVTSIGEIANYCRNPDNSERGPWCYQQKGGGRAYCYIPLCEDEEFVSSTCVKPGAAYIGKVSVTESGKTCQRWDSPGNFVMNRPELFPDPSVKDAQNFCRSPSGSGLKQPWCFTGANGEREVCDIPACTDDTDDTGDITVPIVPEEEKEEPTMDTQQENVMGFVGETVHLPCEVKNVGDRSVMWLKKDGFVVISIKAMMLSDDARFSVQRTKDGWNLKIADINKNDQGTYICSLNTLEPQHKTVELLVKGVPVITTTVDPYSIEQLKIKLSGDVVELKTPHVISSTSVGLEWTVLKAKEFIEGFKVLYRKLSLFKASEELAIKVSLNPVANKGLKYVVQSLEPNTLYSFRVQPYYKSVLGTKSTAKSARTLEGVPSQPPQNVKLTMISRTVVMISWKPPPADSRHGNITSYKIDITTGSYTTKAVTVDGLSYQIDNIKNDTEYVITVAARTSAGTGVPSKPVKLAKPCKAEFVYFDRQCYYVSRRRTYRRRAKSYCERMGAKLATIESKPVFSFLTRYLDSKISRYGKIQFWTGGERVGLKWTWNAESLQGIGEVAIESHAPLTYEDWRSGEPNHRTEIAITMKYSGGYWGWNDLHTSFTYKLRYICEKEMEASKPCKSGWVRFEGSCYYFSGRSDDLTHTEAKKTCRQKLCHLVAINSMKENNFLKSKLRNMTSRSSNYEEFWTGGEREGGSGGDTFIWDTTIPETVPFSQWMNNRSKSAVGLKSDYLILERHGGNWFFDHTRRTRRLPSVCEHQKVTQMINGTKRAVCPTNCDASLNYKDSCYCVKNRRTEWLDAQENCMTEGGRLVSINNAREMEVVTTALNYKKFVGTEWWTGGIPIDGSWVWSEDYAKFTVIPDQYVVWYPGEPNNYDGSEKYLLLDRDSHGWGWNDDRDDGSRYIQYLCQMPSQNAKLFKKTHE